MDRRLDMNHTGSLAGGGAISGNRPPQLKLCGFRCGYGCEEPTDDDGDGGGSDAGSEKTYVESVVQADSRLQANYGDHDDRGGFGEERTNVVLLETGSEDQHLSELSEHSDEDPSAMSSSLEVGSCASSDQSRAVSNHESVRILTPGPGIGVWVEDQLRHANRFPLEYYFLQTPLRLSAQYEHCRGDSLSHLVVPDRPYSVYMLEDVCIEYAVGHRTILVPQVEMT